MMNNPLLLLAQASIDVVFHKEHIDKNVTVVHKGVPEKMIKKTVRIRRRKIANDDGGKVPCNTKTSYL